MDNIDFIYYSATTTDSVGAQTFTQAQYFIPFFDFLLIFLVLIFSVVAVYLTDYFIHPQKTLIKLINKIRISKKNF
jgi:antibiotic biosynthesis monooxygenase (ABM) superfamily enzyme